MTLAVASVNDGEAHLFADLRLSYELETNSDDDSRPVAALKILFVSESVAVAYAGTTEDAHLSIRQAIESVKDVNAKNIAEFLRKKCQDNDGVEFLLISAETPASIFKITSRIFSSSTQGQYWIGDHEAANALLNETILESILLERAFQTILDAQKFSSIGGIVTTAKASNGRVRFQPKMHLVSPYYLLQTQERSVDFGDAQRGGFGYTTLTPREPGKNGWGVHFFQGYIGYFFKVNLALNRFERLTWKSNLDGAIEALNADLGFEVESCGKLGNY